MRTKLKGRLTISKPHYSSGEDSVEITLVDELSGIEAFMIKATLEDFAKALFSSGHKPCEYEYVPNAPLGMLREYKTELVFVPSRYSASSFFNDKKREDSGERFVASFEVDGWKASLSDLSNNHHWTREPLPPGKKPGSDSMVRVGFIRYVAPPASTQSASTPEPRESSEKQTNAGKK